MSKPNILLFAGPPQPDNLTEEACSIQHFLPAFHRLIRLPAGPPRLDVISQPPHAPWRSLPLASRPLHTGFSQVHALGNESSFHDRSEFFTTTAVSTDESTGLPAEDGDAVLTQFCEQSLAAHDSLPSSQLEVLARSSTEDETSFTTTSSTDKLSSRVADMPPPPAIPSHLSDLEDVPSAPRITALAPQTVTLNLIVAVLSIAQPRTVTTRWGRQMVLVEVLVGDDTRSGFAVTFWLPGDKPAESDVAKLRRQDVVLMENVALHVFRNKVYGQSLRRGLTRLSLLWRRDGGGHYSTTDLSRRAVSGHPQKAKVALVQDWVLRFVGGDARETRAKTSWDRPPDNTQ